MQTQRRSMEVSSDTSYCERETWDDWGSRSSLSQVEEVASQSSGHTEEVAALRAERDALARALAAERQRAASAARAHDARLAELHGVIAELVRRRAADKHAGAIPEEDLSDECESTTQPAGELDNDADQSRTEQNDSSSVLSPSELPTPQEPKVLPDDTDTSAVEIRVERSPSPSLQVEKCDTSLDLSERDSEICLSTARCCQHARGAGSGAGSGGSCDRDRGSSDAPRVCTASPGRSESRQAKVASRVRLRRTDDAASDKHLNNEDSWCAAAAERLALDVCAQADLREALVAANNDGEALTSLLACCRARCRRLQADVAVLRAALQRAADTQHRLYCACAVQESWCVSVCLSLRAADRALETYDVLLALAESATPDERAAAELVARQLLARLDACDTAALGEPLLSPGPWLQHDNLANAGEWTPECEARLRAHAARLKADTVSSRPARAPALYSHHDVDEEEITKPTGAFNMADMEAAVMMQEVLTAKERQAAHAALHIPACEPYVDPVYRGHVAPSAPAHKKSSGDGRRRARRHWLETHASETDL